MRQLGLRLVIATALLAGTAVAENPGRELSHNPFSRPPSEVINLAQPGQLSDEPQSIQLQATLVTGKSGLANVAGRVLRPGDEISGYTLLRVYEDRAVFLQSGREITVYVKPELADEDE